MKIYILRSHYRDGTSYVSEITEDEQKAINWIGEKDFTEMNVKHSYTVWVRGFDTKDYEKKSTVWN